MLGIIKRFELLHKGKKGTRNIGIADEAKPPGFVFPFNYRNDLCEASMGSFAKF